MMSTKKIVMFAILILLIANLGLLAFIIMKPNTRNSRKENSPKKNIIKRLGFDETQSETFLGLVNFHREEIITYDEKIKIEKQELFSLLGQTNIEQTKADSLTSNIANLQKEIELLHFSHFKKIKAMCKEEQIEKFNLLSKDIVDIFNRKKVKTMRKKKND